MWADGKLLGLDLETTGVDPMTAIPVSFALVEYENSKRGRVRTGLVNPEIPIPAETSAVHGITDEMVRERGGDLLSTIDGIAVVLLDSLVDDIPLVGMNLRYDLTVLDSCHRRLRDGLGLRDIGWEGAVLDAIVLDRHVDKYRKGSRKLGALADFYGVPFANAHSAAADAIASVEVVLAIVRKYPEIAELSVDELHGFQAVWHRDWAESYSEYRVKRGDSALDECEFSWPISCEPKRDLPVPPITDGQKTHLVIKLKDEHGVEDRRERLFVLSTVLGRPVESSSDLNSVEYRTVVGFLDVLVGTPGMAALLEDLPREEPPASLEPPEPPKRIDPPDTDSEALLESSTVATVASMSAEDVRVWCEKCGIEVREDGKLIPVGRLRMLVIPAILRLRRSGDPEACELF